MFHWYRHFTASAVILTLIFVHVAVVLATNAEYGFLENNWIVIMLFCLAISFYSPDNIKTRMKTTIENIRLQKISIACLIKERKVTRHDIQEMLMVENPLPEDVDIYFKHQLANQIHSMSRKKRDLQSKLNYLWTLDVIHQIVTWNFVSSLPVEQVAKEKTYTLEELLK